MLLAMNIWVFCWIIDFENHAARLLQRANAKSITLYKIRRYLNQYITLRLYKSLLLPMLEYGDLFIISASVKKHSRILNLEHHKKANVQPLAYRRYLSICQIMFNLSFEGDRLERIRGMYTRSTDVKTFSLPFTRNNNYQKQVFYQGCKMWNSLPPWVRMIRDSKLFKKKIKWLLLYSFKQTCSIEIVQLVVDNFQIDS